jgi:hypothetical protein
MKKAKAKNSVTIEARYDRLMESLNRASPLLEQAGAMLDVLEFAAPHADSLRDHTLVSFCIACETLIADARRLMDGGAEA